MFFFLILGRSVCFVAIFLQDLLLNGSIDGILSLLLWYKCGFASYKTFVMKQLRSTLWAHCFCKQWYLLQLANSGTETRRKDDFKHECFHISSKEGLIYFLFYSNEYQHLNNDFFLTFEHRSLSPVLITQI